MSDLNSKAPAPKWLSPMLDFGPLLLFFGANWLGSSKTDPTRGPLIGTAVFMVAIIIALIVSKVKLGKISPMMWVSAILVTGFGALTLWFRDPSFIQLKPTLIYLLFAAILFGGLLRGKALLKYLLEYAFDGVNVAFDTWLAIKTWGVTILFFIFNMTQIPMLMRNGLKLDVSDGNGT
jgi:intracellular septation protein